MHTSAPHDPAEGITIAIDGPAGSGKSTVSRLVAEALDGGFLDTGAMYRAIAWACLEDGVDLTDREAVARVAEGIDLDLGTDPAGATVVVAGTDITAAIRDGNQDAELAMQVYVHRLRKYVGSYAFVLGGLDAIAFTAGIGENVPEVRERVLSGLEGFGIRLDPARNAERAKGVRVISADDSPVTVLIVPTDEELAIAQQALEVARSKR